jgi:hypothetical protein
MISSRVFLPALLALHHWGAIFHFLGLLMAALDSLYLGQLPSRLMFYFKLVLGYWQEPLHIGAGAAIFCPWWRVVIDSS